MRAATTGSPLPSRKAIYPVYRGDDIEASSRSGSTTFFAWRLRMLERLDPEIFIRPDRNHIQELSIQEDLEVSNQFNVFGVVKPGLFRLLTLKFLLMLLDYSARHVLKSGFLTRIRTSPGSGPSSIRLKSRGENDNERYHGHCVNRVRPDPHNIFGVFGRAAGFGS